MVSHVASGEDGQETNGRQRRLGFGVLWVGVLSVMAIEPVFAQTVGTEFCNSDLAQTAKNLFTVIQFGGPLLGGLVALGATVALPVVRRADRKKELQEVRTQGIVWGVIVAPLATVIIAFLLNNVVVGGASCGF